MQQACARKMQTGRGRRAEEAEGEAGEASPSVGRVSGGHVSTEQVLQRVEEVGALTFCS